jgi:hypothetical protein
MVSIGVSLPRILKNYLIRKLSSYVTKQQAQRNDLMGPASQLMPALFWFLGMDFSSTLKMEASHSSETSVFTGLRCVLCALRLELTPWSGALPERPSVSQLLMNFPTIN